MTTPNLALPLLAAAQAQKHVTVNEALSRLDGLVQLSVISSTLTVPPATPAEGDRYIVAASATGAWTGWDDSVALFSGGVWLRLIPQTGWLAWDQGRAHALVFTGSVWATKGMSYVGAFVGVSTIDFESGSIPASFVFDAPGASVVAQADAGAGTSNAMRFRPITDNQSTWFTLTQTYGAATTVTIRHKTSSESGYDFFRVYLDGVQQFQASGVPTAFSANSFSVPAGSHTIKCEYSKDPNNLAGDDTTYISQITFVGATVSYEVGDVVTYQGSVWLCAVAGTSAVPGTNSDWLLLERSLPSPPDATVYLDGTGAWSTPTPPLVADKTLAQGPNGAAIGVHVVEELLTGLTGASVTSTITIPDRAIVLAVSTRTVTAIAGATSYDCGIAGTPNKFGGTLGIAAGSTNVGVVGPQAFYAPTPIVLTANGGSFTGGDVRIAIQYLLPSAPQS